MCNKKVMKVTVGKEKKDKVNWLSCCFGGYGAMDSANKKNGAKRRSSKARIFWCVSMMDNPQWLYSDFNNRGRIDYMGL
ncbi:MAG: hypothetical protein ACXQTR_06340 [Candidatus Methanospirareceae archaeon]